MVRPREIRSKRPCVGQIDTEAFDVPLDAFFKCKGFGLRRGYPFTAKALKVYTTAELRTSKRIRALHRWTDPDDNVYPYAVCDGGLWKVTSPSAKTLVSTIAPGGTASRSDVTITVASVPNGTLVGVVRDGDEFYFDADGKDAGGTVAGVGTGAFTVDAYAGSETSGAFTIWRRMTDVDSWLVPAGGRLFVSDGTGPLHEYGPDSPGSATYAFRQTGVPPPPYQPTMTLDAGGSLSEGDYTYYIAFESLRGETGDTVQTRQVTATADQKTTMVKMPTAPESPRASRYRIYRSKAGKVTGYFHLTKDFTDKATGVSGQIITVAFGGMTADAHIYRRVRFLTTGNSYEIADNAGDTIEVAAAEDISGELVTDDVYVYGGYKISTIQAASATFIDYSSDDDLDTDNEAPTGHDEPPLALKHLVAFQGGGRLGGVVGALFYCSGRSPTESKQGFRDLLTYGLGEFGYWIDSDRAYEVGAETGVDVKGVFELAKVLYAVTKTDIWWFNASSRDMLDYQWFAAAQDVGCLEGKTIAVLSDGAYWLGRIGGQIDLVYFDGQFGYGRMRRKLRATLDSIKSYSEATGGKFKGYYYLSYDSDGGGTNDETLRYSIADRTVDTQAWGCGVFMNPFISTVTPTLYCGDSTDLGHIREVEGAAQNLGSDTTRLLETGDVHFNDPEHPPKYTSLALTLIVEA